MGTTEKRRYSRIDSINLLNYVYEDKEKEKALQGMGRTLNVSESGILLETHVSLEEGVMVSIMIGLKEDMVDIKGEVVFIIESPEGRYQSGINFKEIDDLSLETLRKYIKAFRAQEKES